MASNPTQTIFPRRVLHPDTSKPTDLFDEQNEHFLHNFTRWQTMMEKRDEYQDNHAKERAAFSKRKKPFANALHKTSTQKNKLKVDETTGLIYGLGYDDVISEQLRNTTSARKREENNNLNELVEKLGYLDLRDFIAINKYILQAKNHEESVNQAKAKLLTIAIEKMNEIKNNEVLNTFKKIDANLDINNIDKESQKVYYLFNNFEDSKKLFYKYYYEIKEFRDMEENKVMDEFEKYEKMMKAKSELGEAGRDEQSSDVFESYMDKIINSYRKQRTTEIKIDVEDIMEQINALKENSENKMQTDELLLMIKYYAFFNKFNKFYIPTDMETEKLIVFLSINF
jgi:hypothetical protein